MPRRPSTSLKHRLQVAGRFRGAGHRCCRPLRFVGSFCRLVGSFASSRDTEKAPANPVRPAGFFPRPGVLKCLLRSALFRQTIAMAACRTCIGFLEASAAHSKATRSAMFLVLSCMMPPAKLIRKFRARSKSAGLTCCMNGSKATSTGMVANIAPTSLWNDWLED